MNLGRCHFLANMKTMIWQKTNAGNLFREKTINGETIRLYKIPNGKHSCALIGYRGKKGLEPVRQVKINAGRCINNEILNFGVIDACKKNAVKTLDTTDLKTGNLIYCSTTANGSYYKNNAHIDQNELREFNLTVDSTKPASFTTVNLPHKILSRDNGCVNSAQMSVAKIQTDKGTLVQTVEQCVTTNNELYHVTDDSEKVIADKITLYLNGEKIKEYLSPIYGGSKASS